MATLMSWRSSGGAQGRCDAKCHYAASPDCDCMCQGRYHGAGRDGTLDQKVREYGDEVLETLAAQGLIDPAQGRMTL